MKYDLSDTTFALIVKLDTIERLENILATTSFILTHFETNVNVLEVSYRYNGYLKKLLDPKVKYQFHQDDDPILYRTKYINAMMENVLTSYVSIWDVDVIAPSQQVQDSIDILRNKEANFVYPYNKLFLETTYIIRNMFLDKNQDMQVLIKNQKRMNVLYPPNPVGGAFFCDLASYKESGLENEHFYGWGLEDGERYIRWKRKGFTIKRIEGPLFHLSHPRAINSDMHSPDQKIIKTKLINLTNNL